jgi:hypothetical protein
MWKKSNIIGTPDNDEQKRLYKINKKNAEPYCMLKTFENSVLF